MFFPGSAASIDFNRVLPPQYLANHFMMPFDLAQLFSKLEDSLRTDHPSMLQRANPVLCGLHGRRILGEGGVRALKQYSFLPANIVSLLSAMALRLSDWESVNSELLRNVGEEMGSGTSGIPHFDILKRGLARELSINVNALVPETETSQFLHRLRQAIADRPAAFVAGMAYALEDSALPELEIVALVINATWRALGHSEDVIRPAAMRSRAHCEELRASKDASIFTLEDFFAVHLQDFEVGHKKGLIDTTVDHLKGAEDAAEFARGFEYVLSLMDEWWASLAKL